MVSPRADICRQVFSSILSIFKGGLFGWGFTKAFLVSSTSIFGSMMTSGIALESSLESSSDSFWTILMPNSSSDALVSFSIGSSSLGESLLSAADSSEFLLSISEPTDSISDNLAGWKCTILPRCLNRRGTDSIEFSSSSMSCSKIWFTHSSTELWLLFGRYVLCLNTSSFSRSSSGSLYQLPLVSSTVSSGVSIFISLLKNIEKILSLKIWKYKLDIMVWIFNKSIF